MVLSRSCDAQGMMIEFSEGDVFVGGAEIHGFK